MKIAKDRGRRIWLFSSALAALVVGTTCQAWAQQGATQRYQVPPPAPTAKANDQYKVNPKETEVPGLKPTAIPVNPGDPIAIVNNQIISRQQLADECVARRGKEILELLINRTLIDQALRAQKLAVSGAEIDQEIETVAQRYGISREGWLRTLDKERNISPVQYARDIIYPALALRKLCAGRVDVTNDDIKKAFEAQFGEKLRVRMILVNKQPVAIAIWEELRRNPGGFEKIAQEQSMDSASRALGGLVAEPITRHAYPQNLSDAAFYQLVDGDPADKDPSHKPKDGDFTGPIQVGDMLVILRRESVVAGDKTASLKDPRVAKQTQEMIYEVKLKEAMQEKFKELLKSAAIENQFTGTVKLADEEKDPSYGTEEGKVKLMSRNSDDNGGDPRAAAAPEDGAVKRTKMPRPAALSADAARQFDKLEQRPLKPGGNPPAKAAAAGAPATNPAPAPGAAPAPSN